MVPLFNFKNLFLHIEKVDVDKIIAKKLKILFYD